MSTAPASLHSAPARKPTFERRSWLNDIVVDYGPEDVMGRLFLKADTELRAKGVNFAFAPLEELIAVNKQHSDSWRPILPIFDPDCGGATPENSFALLGYNNDGECVTAQAARIYTLTKNSLKEEIESLRIFYADPERSRLPGERMEVTAPIADQIDGRVAFVGAVWYRPDFRGRGLVNVMSRAVRAYAYTRWLCDFTFTFMADSVYSQGVAQRAGYANTDWAIMMHNTPVLRGDVIRAALVWTTADDEIAFFRKFLAETDTKVDAVVDNRTADQARVR
ncbi:MAG: hypothetical protein R3D68_16115 [Hyphomicrobiaceae bacterium]